MTESYQAERTPSILRASTLDGRFRNIEVSVPDKLRDVDIFLFERSTNEP
jgi:hypothetical protein